MTVKGVEVTLHDAAGSPIASQTGIEVAWFDTDAVSDLSRVAGRSAVVTTDSGGKLALDLSNVSGLAVGDWGFLLCYRADATDHKDSPIFASRMQVATIAAGTDVTPPNTWEPPAGWLALPDLTGLQKFAGLFAVYPESNYVALSAAGDYTLNWGDGSGDQNVGSGVQSEKNIAWAEAAPSSDVGIADAVAVTLADAGDTVNRTAHGFKNGEAVAFDSIVTTAGLSTYTAYYVVNAAADTFQVAASIGGSAIALANDGSGSVYRPRHRQVIVTVAPNGGNLTALNLHLRHSALSTNYGVGWLDIAVNAEHLTDLRVGVQAPGSDASVVAMPALCRVSANVPAVANFSHMFYSCTALASVPLLNTAAGTNFSNMFTSCPALRSGRLVGTAQHISYSNCHLGPAALNEIYRGLATVSAKTITVAGNWGAASDDPSIATAKGWTVTG